MLKEVSIWYVNSNEVSMGYVSHLNYTLDCKLKEMGFDQKPSDPCLYVSKEGEMFIVAVYVDDIRLACKDNTRMEQVKKILQG